jgi:hypothetical protein
MSVERQRRRWGKLEASDCGHEICARAVAYYRARGNVKDAEVHEEYGKKNKPRTGKRIRGHGKNLWGQSLEQDILE